MMAGAAKGDVEEQRRLLAHIRKWTARGMSPKRLANRLGLSLDVVKAALASDWSTKE